jgi:Transposase
MARPTKQTPDRRATLLRALRSGASYNEAARAADMSPSLFRQWRSDDASLAAEVADAVAAAEAQETQRLDALLAEMTRKAENMTWQQAAWLLETHFPDEWGPPARRGTRRNRGT